MSKWWFNKSKDLFLSSISCWRSSSVNLSSYISETHILTLCKKQYLLACCVHMLNNNLKIGSSLFTQIFLRNDKNDPPKKQPEKNKTKQKKPFKFFSKLQKRCKLSNFSAWTLINPGTAWIFLCHRNVRNEIQKLQACLEVVCQHSICIARYRKRNCYFSKAVLPIYGYGCGILTSIKL